MRRWLLVILPAVALFIALSLFVDRRQALSLVTGALLVATVIAAVFTKDTATVRGLLATLLWSIVLFELLSL
jgi:hypothetical protein